MFNFWGWCKLGRPRILKTKYGGEVVCRNVGPEIIDVLQKALDGMEPTEAKAVVETPAEKSGDMSYMAVGTYKGKDGWYVTEVKYNPETGEAELVATSKVGDLKVYAIEAFKIKASEHNLV